MTGHSFLGKCELHGKVRIPYCVDCVQTRIDEALSAQAKKHEEEIHKKDEMISSATSGFKQAAQLHFAEKKEIFEEMRKLIYCVHSVESIDGGYKAWYEKWQTLKKKFIGEAI